MNVDSVVESTGCLFTNLKAAKPFQEMNLPTWIEKIRNGEYKQSVEAYRGYKMQGLDDLARNVKTSIEAFMCAGVCSNGRKKDDVFQVEADVYMVDYDVYDPEWVAAAKERLKELKWVAAAHDSIGGGLRLFVVLMGIQRQFYAYYIKTVLQDLDAFLGVQHDEHCDHLMRLSVASYDPNAWVRPVEEMEAYPFSDEQLLAIQEKIQATEVRKRKASVMEVDFATVKYSNVRNYTADEILKIMDDYMRMCPYEKGHHHDSLVMGGAMANCEGFTTADLTEMAQLISKHHPVKGYDFNEILRNLMYGYTHPNMYYLSLKRQRFAQKDLSDEDLQPGMSNEELIDKTCPCFGDDIIESLPTLITSLLMGLTKRQRDVLIASIMAALSSVMANVNCHYRGKKYSANIAFCVVAPAGSGKGICLEAQRLVQLIQDEFDENYNAALMTYKRARHAWNIEKEQAQKEGRDLDMSKEPKEPKQVDFLNSDVISLSRFIEEQYNSPYGMLMVVSELAEYIRIEKAEFGQLMATHRKVMMNEPISMNFKACGMVRVPFPKASFIFAGTNEDYIKFMKNVDNGTLSRIAVLTGASSLKWDELTNEKHNLSVEKELSRRYEEAAKTVKELFHYLIENPTDVYFDPEMFDELNTFFDYATQKLVHVHHEELASLINRGAILCLRLGAVFTCLRKFENKSTQQEIPINREDFDTALAMTKIFLRHAAQYSTILPGATTHREPMKAFDPSDRVYDELPEQFTSSQAVDAFCKFGIARTTAYDFLKLWRENGLITTLAKGKHFKAPQAAKAEEQA